MKEAEVKKGDSRKTVLVASAISSIKGWPGSSLYTPDVFQGAGQGSAQQCPTMALLPILEDLLPIPASREGTLLASYSTPLTGSDILMEVVSHPLASPATLGRDPSLPHPFRQPHWLPLAQGHHTSSL